MGQKIQLVVADNQEIMRLGIQAALQKNNQIKIVAEAKTETTILKIVREHQPDVVLLGLSDKTSKPNRRANPAICQTIEALRTRSQVNILVMSHEAHAIEAQQMIRAGARGLVLKREILESCELLIRGITTIARTKKLFLSPALYPYGINLDETPKLTRRRIEMMQLMADHPELTVAQMAHRLGIAESTLRNNLSAISQALGSHNINGAMLTCLKLDLIQLKK